MKPNEEKQKQLEKEVEELKAQLQRRDAEEKVKDDLLRKREEELRRLRRQPADSIGCLEEGVITWEVEKEEIAEEPLFSPPTELAGLPFRITCRFESETSVTASYAYDYDRFEQVRQDTKTVTKYLAVGLCFNDENGTTNDSVIVCCALTLTSTKNPHCHTKNNFVLSSTANWEVPRFLSWAYASDQSKGFLKDDRFIIEADLKLICHYKNSMANFASRDPLLSDVTLLVGGEAFHVSKTYLAHFSKYFKVIFFSNCAEKDEDEVVLPEVKAKEFDELLRMIHPQRVKTTVTKDNVEYILRLADFFDIQLVLWECIDFLKNSSDFSQAAKLQLTDQYRLPELQYDVLEKIKDRSMAKAIVDSAVYKTFSQPLKIHILEKLVKFV